MRKIKPYQTLLLPLLCFLLLSLASAQAKTNWYLGGAVGEAPACTNYIFWENANGTDWNNNAPTPDDDWSVVNTVDPNNQAVPVVGTLEGSHSVHLNGGAGGDPAMTSPTFTGGSSTTWNGFFIYQFTRKIASLIKLVKQV